jgi:predicted ribosome quality control (RQC) complex YloA/Tae2 family protein
LKAVLELQYKNQTAHDWDKSRSILRQAVELAAYYSQAREATRVAVDYTQKRHVRRVKGARPGLVTYDHEQTIHVTP